MSERRRGRSKGTSVGGVQTPRQDRSLFAVYNKIRRSKIGPSANILMQPLGGLIEKSVIKARPRRSKWMYYCACNNIFFLFSHFFPFELNYRSRGILCEATIFLSCSSIQTTQRWFSTRETSSFAGNLFLPLLTRLLSKGRWILEGWFFYSKESSIFQSRELSIHFYPFGERGWRISAKRTTSLCISPLGDVFGGRLISGHHRSCPRYAADDKPIAIARFLRNRRPNTANKTKGLQRVNFSISSLSRFS